MSPSPELSTAGSSTYSSDTMHVGDGTWDSSRDDFLLPNLQGLNFATMRYNGMGNRFLAMSGYHSLIKAHGILAAITFLGAVPLSIFLIRFYGRNKTLASRLHIWLNILALLLTTVVFILGFIAVGPTRALTNPHHGIGVAIYVLLWAQSIQGCLFHRKDLHIRRFSKPLKVLLHDWLGRATALLAVTQIALGLTLYGSPVYLFVLYTLYMFGLVLAWFILTWLVERRKAEYEGSEGSYFSDDPGRRPPQKRHSHLGTAAVAGAAGLGALALWNRHKDRAKRPTRMDGSESGTGTATSYLSEEKYSEDDEHRGRWARRLLEIGAVGGGLLALKKLFGRHDTASETRPYRPALGGNQSVVDSASFSQLDEGRPPPVRPTTPPGNSPGHYRPSHPLAQPPLTPGSRESGDSYSYYSYMSGSPSRQERHGNTFRNALAAGGAGFAIRQIFKNRRQKKEEQRAEQLRAERLEEERIQRMNSVHRYTGDGAAPPPRRPRPDQPGSQTASDASSIMSEHVGRPPPIAGGGGGGGGGAAGAVGAAGVAAAAAGALADRHRIRPVGPDPPVNVPGPPSAAVPPAAAAAAGAGGGRRPEGHGVPPPPPHFSEIGSSGSEFGTIPSGRQRQRHHLGEGGGAAAAAGLAGAGAVGVAAAAATATEESRRRRRTSQINVDGVESPPVSVKVKMHNDGRHVTLRRLTEEEAAAQRRHERRASRRRNSSVGSGSGGGEGPPGPSQASRWHRTEGAAEAPSAQYAAAAHVAAGYGPEASISPAAQHAPSHGLYPTPPPPPPGTQHVDPRMAYNLPAPPPIPGSSSYIGPAGSITSPGTDGSGASEYAMNRRRRRAERAKAHLAARDAKNSVEFS